MRTFRHWTPRYLWNRLNEKIYRQRNPGLPWLTPEANRFLTTYLRFADTGIEFGSGRSTIWFAARVVSLTSIEHNPVWYERVRGMMAERCILNVNYLLKEKEHGDALEGMDAAYVQVAAQQADCSLDFALVDGIYRGSCACAVLDKLKPGGMLVIDNINLYLSCKSHSPNSRSYADGPANEYWAQFIERTKGWRYFWTSNGVSDTAFFFKPQSASLSPSGENAIIQSTPQ